MSIPNWLSIFRIVLIPAFAWSYLSLGEKPILLLIPAGILVISGLTDALDGYIARRFNMVTSLGHILDPLADKLTLATVCGCLSVRRPELFWLFVVYFTKELVVLIASLIVVKRLKLKLIPSNFLGKAATFAFYLLMLAVVLFPTLDLRLMLAGASMIIALVLMSMVSYGVTYLREIKSK